MSQIGGFFDLWNPVLLLIVVVIGYCYNRFVVKGNGSSTKSEPLSITQQLSFYAGLFLFYVGQGSPISYIGHHYLFSMHMLSQTILYLIVPILIWLGTPGWLVRVCMKNLVFRSLFSFFTRPLIALFMFNMLFSIYHMPFIMDYLMVNDVWLLVYHSVLLITAFFMWFPVFSPMPELNGLNDLKKMAYIFGNGVLLTPACALIIFADSIIYDMYGSVTVPFAHLSPLDDQQLGGVIMKVLQEIIYASTLAYIFFRWYRRERKDEDELDPIPSQESLTNQGGSWNRA
ncbi:cytochrome C oxidase assembly protein [Paenibacillus pectinilyticus]|uniref:Cytochrome C oxidase assembly protein n=1 Tax=Paenibacillus pectinilyticus TaxID=512399 RepID=A0A1C0ZT22_9BACL|nr:cytochrome c oxidase assembly protein [Paenibacillus pectinilyticus]OCT11226.1 cytochrome C oxidase assembly protein [Paenibacillus pectinilyticus]